MGESEMKIKYTVHSDNNKRNNLQDKERIYKEKRQYYIQDIKQETKINTHNLIKQYKI